jgi:hypothetical protein
MQRLASLLLVAAALPVQATSADPTLEPLKDMKNFTAPVTHCYFIKQANRQLQSPQDKPGFMPLAGVEKLSTTAPFANCTSDQRVIKTVIKTDIKK